MEPTQIQKKIIPIEEAYTLLTGKKVRRRTALVNLKKLNLPTIKIGAGYFIKMKDVETFFNETTKTK